MCNNYGMTQIHNHDINYYKQLRNEGMTWSEIAAHIQIPKSSLAHWVNNNFDEIVTYDYIEK